jgi:RNA polymerase sigma factor (sigma-70 family)
MQRSLSGLRDEERFGAWTYQLARNAIADHRRARARHPLAVDDAPEGSVHPPGHAEDGDVERELATYVAQFIAMLPTPYREALTLTELEGLTQKEAAEIMGVSLSGMKSRVQRGRERLRGLLRSVARSPSTPAGASSSASLGAPTAAATERAFRVATSGNSPKRGRRWQTRDKPTRRAGQPLDSRP